MFMFFRVSVGFSISLAEPGECFATCASDGMATGGENPCLNPLKEYSYGNRMRIVLCSLVSLTVCLSVSLSLCLSVSSLSIGLAKHSEAQMRLFYGTSM